MFKGTRVALATASRVHFKTVPLRSAYQNAFLRPFEITVATQTRKPLFTQRFYGSGAAGRVLDAPAEEVFYKDVKKLATHPNPNIVLVDVREPNEYEAGHIPGAVNIPFKTMPGALGLDPADFESTLGFPKPDVDKQLLFYCKGGVRSTGSEQLASTFGYDKRSNYKGSYEDWVKNESGEKTEPSQA